MLIVLSIFHYQTGNFIPVLEHYVSSRSVETRHVVHAFILVKSGFWKFWNILLSEALLQHRINSL